MIIAQDLKKVSIAKLRSLTTSDLAAHTTFYCIDQGKEGLWYYDATDTTSNDNLGTILVSGTFRIKRIIGDSIYPEWFGAIGDGITNDTNPINNAILYCSQIGGGKVKFYDYKTYLSDSIIVKPNVHIDFGKCTIKKSTNSGTRYTNHMIITDNNVINSTYYGQNYNIRISGGYFDGSLFSGQGNMFRLYFLENSIIENTTIINYFSGGSTGNGAFAYGIGGKNLLLSNLQTRNGQYLYEDGIHILHGSKIRIQNADINSGDDAIALGVDIGDIFDTENDGISYIDIVNCNLNSKSANGITIYSPSGTTSTNFSVSNVNISNITGNVANLRNGGFNINDKGYLGRINNININNVYFSVGSSSHDNTNPYGIFLQGVNNISMSKIKLSLTEGTTQTIGFKLCNIYKCNNIKIDELECNSLKSGEGIYVQDSTNIKINKLDVSQTSISNTNVIRISKVSNFNLSNSEIKNVNDTINAIYISGNSGDNTSVTIDNVYIQHLNGVTGYALSIISNVVLKWLIIQNSNFSDVGGIIDSFSNNQKLDRNSLLTVTNLILRNNLGVNWESAVGSSNNRFASATFQGGAVGSEIFEIKRPTLGLSYYFSVPGQFTIREGNSTNVLSTRTSGSLNRIIAGVDNSNSVCRNGEISAENISSSVVDGIGGILNVESGLGTGQGNPQPINIRTPDKTISGSTSQSYSTKAVFFGRGGLGVGTIVDDGSSQLIIAGDISISQLGGRIKILEGTGSPIGRITLSSGISVSIPVTGMTTSSKVFLQFKSASGTVTSTSDYKANLSTGSFTIEAIQSDRITRNTLDNSTIDYFCIN